MRKFLVCLLAALAMTTSPALVAAEEGGGGEGGAYLKLGVGARAIGQGSAFTAVADDATTIFWNAAGTSKLDKFEATGMHANLSLDRQYNFLAYAGPIDKRSSWGFAYTRFAIDGIPETRETAPGSGVPVTTDGNPGSPVQVFGLFGDIEENFALNYSRKLFSKFRVGGNVRFLQNRMYGASGTGVGFDVGGLFEYSKKLHFGLSVRDLFEQTSYGTGRNDDVPVTITAGLAYKKSKETILSVDLNKTENLDWKVRAGAERWIGKKYAVRLGTNDGDLAAGTSIKYKGWQFDYAYQAQELGDQQRLSFVRRF